MKPSRFARVASLFALAALFAAVPAFAQEAKDPRPIKALMITGGPYHDYGKQKVALADGLAKRINIEWTIYHEGDRGGTRFKLPIYEKPDWAKGYDIVVHNECFADVVDEDFIRKVCKAHEEGVPGVFIHCCMHTFRAVRGFDEYRKMLGVTTVRHETARLIEVKPVKADHPVMKGFPAVFRTPVVDEVYVIDKVWPDCTPLATAYGIETRKDHPCVWVNQYGKARVFGTTLGHPQEVIESDVFLDTVARGVLWATNKLGDDGKPLPGYGPKPAAPATPAAAAKK